ncbi:aspartyl-tRNA synthetase-like protein [Aureobasidium pullulans]|uniref:aspartate--tRNA ligase n=1 Tax=Aureobasidium pullulans TaxID=5580 RepID=A0A4S9CUW3_AURPU|nr:aspartyl-tRNA synthetase-like protein [Aureobasidium pullulans]
MKKALHKLVPGHHRRSTSASGNHSNSDSGTPTSVSRASTDIPDRSRQSLDSSARPGSKARFASPRNSTSIDTRKSLDVSRASTDMSHRRQSRSTSHHRATHSPLGAFRHKLRRGSSSSSSDDGRPLNALGEPMSKAQLRKRTKLQQKEERHRKAEEHAAADRQLQQQTQARAEAEETGDMKSKYGILPLNYYAPQQPPNEKRVNLLELSERDVGSWVTFRARVHMIRQMSSRRVFIQLRQQTASIQGVLHEHAGVSLGMVYWTKHLKLESVVRVRAVVQEPKAKQGKITGCSIENLEVSIHELHVEGSRTMPLPFNVAEAEVTREEAELTKNARHHISDRTRLANRIVDLRSNTSQSIFRVQSGVSSFFREYLRGQGFIEIHTPKLQGGATESGASVFKVDYFGRPAFLAQSPQLAKQMCISADFGKVFEIGAVFRAENSNTHRHMTEYTGLDLEMAIDEHYHEVLRTLDGLFKFMFKKVYENYRHEIDTLKKHFPHEDLVWLDKTPIIPFSEGIRLLNDSGWRDEHGNPLPEDEDLGTRDEIQLGKVIKQVYGTDYYVLDKFPATARPFYAMPDPENSKVTNSFDIFLRGQEILSGGQRIHDEKMLIKQMERLKMDPSTLDEYMQGFAWGAPPHGGGGIGLERMLMLLLSLGDIRHATLFPRDPKSFPTKPVVKQLRHPEASTLHPPWEGQDRHAAGMELPPVEQLIANYGDASNTSWLEPRTEVWRDDVTGAAVGFVPHQGYAITVGDPLCHKSQYARTIQGYLHYIKKERGIKPLWLLCGGDVEEVLSSHKFDWRTFSVAAEQRLDPGNNPAVHDHDIQRKIRHASKEGVKVHDYPLGTPVPAEIKKKIDGRIKDWLANRKGKQVHLTDIHPWQDEAHRQYHYTTDKDGQISGFVIMAQLSPDHGWQVKFSLDFPGAPSGAIELLVMHALSQVAAGGAQSVTFGGGASSKLTPGHNLKGTRIKVLSKAYHAIATELKLTAKSEFREKLGAQDDPIYVCYPPHGLGPGGVKAILTFFEDTDDANN